MHEKCNGLYPRTATKLLHRSRGKITYWTGQESRGTKIIGQEKILDKLDKFCVQLLSSLSPTQTHRPRYLINRLLSKNQLIYSCTFDFTCNFYFHFCVWHKQMCTASNSHLIFIGIRNMSSIFHDIHMIPLFELFSFVSWCSHQWKLSFQWIQLWLFKKGFL